MDTAQQAVILAGGLGTRLRSAVADVPKVMADVGGRPFLEYIIDQLRHAGVDDAVVCVGYRAEAIERHFGDGARWGIRLAYSVESQPLGTGGALRLARPMLSGDRWLVMNGDSFFDISLALLGAAHRPAQTPVTIALGRVADARRYGEVTLSSDGLITAFVEKPATQAPVPGLINTGLYIIERPVFDLIPADRPASFERDVLPQLVGGRLRGAVFDGYFIDIGVPEDYARARRELPLRPRLP